MDLHAPADLGVDVGWSTATMTAPREVAAASWFRCCSPSRHRCWLGRHSNKQLYTRLQLMEAGLCLLHSDSSVDLQTWAPALPSYNHPFPRSVSPCRFQRMCLTLGVYRAILKKSRRPTGRLFCWEQPAGSVVPVPHQRSHPCHRTLEAVAWVLDREQVVHDHAAAGRGSSEQGQVREGGRGGWSGCWSP